MRETVEIEGASFQFGEVLSATQDLRLELRQALASSRDPKVVELVGELDDVRIVGSTADAPPLTIAFIGQYNAGKSTVLKVLTGREDILIDSNVCTDAVTAYDWNGIRLLDTPGIKAGRPDHDETTHAAIGGADLMAFVITNELFDDTIGRHFRSLAFDRQHAPRMLLIVNKMDQDPGSPETKRADIAKVTMPLTPEDFRSVFIDARTWLEAQNADDEDRTDLLELANVNALTDALNAFTADRGLMGRLSGPLIAMRTIARQATALLATDLPQERAALELLHRERGILLASGARLRTRLGGLIIRAVSDIGGFGDRVAEAIEPGKVDSELAELHREAEAGAATRSAELAGEARRVVQDELDELQRQLDALRHGVLARKLIGGAAAETSGTAVFEDFETPSRQSGRTLGMSADWFARSKKAGEIASNIGNRTARWATGPAAAEGAAAFSLSTARGSEAHKMVYDVGKFFGVKFQPWGALKVARAIGNAGRVISAAGGVLGVIAQIAEDVQKEQHRRELQDLRNEVRSAYREAAASVQASFWEQFDRFLLDFYEPELLAINAAADELTAQRADRSSGAAALRTLDERVAILVDRVIGSRQIIVAT